MRSLREASLYSLLLAMTLAEAIATSRIQRVTGFTGDRAVFVTTRRFVPPTILSRMSGRSAGGRCRCRVKCALAHHGMLFLDELPEFKHHVLEVLRQPFEESLI